MASIRRCRERQKFHFRERGGGGGGGARCIPHADMWCCFMSQVYRSAAVFVPKNIGRFSQRPRSYLCNMLMRSHSLAEDQRCDYVSELSITDAIYMHFCFICTYIPRQSVFSWNTCLMSLELVLFLAFFIMNMNLGYLSLVFS